MAGKSKFFDRLLLSIASITLFSSSYVLVDDQWLFQATTTSGQAALIGEFINSVNDVRRKLNENFVWLPAKNMDVVYEGDSVFTGPSSEAVVKLKDGTEISISPNSLVVIKTINNQASLDLQFGDLVGKLKNKNSKIVISTGGKRTVLKGNKAEIAISKKKVGGTRLRVVSGNVEVNADKVKKNLKKNQSIDFKKSGKVDKVQQASVDLTYPKYGSSLGYQDRFMFSWETSTKVSLYLIEVSTDKKFKKEVLRKTTASNSIELSKLKLNKLLFWRIRGLDDKKKLIAASFTGQFRLFSITPPTLITPPDESEHTVETSSDGDVVPGQNIFFSWKIKNTSTQFEIQISNDDGFKTNVISKKISKNYFEFTPTQPGRQYWRVRALGKQSTVFSDSRFFTLDVQQQAAPLAPPVPNVTPLNYTKGTGSGLELTWKNSEGAEGYLIEFSSDPDFDSQIHSARTTDLQYLWDDPVKGQLYWRVSAIDAEDTVGPPSKTGEIEILGVPLTTPQLSELVKKSIAGYPTQISWSPVERASSYEINVSTDPEFKQGVQTLTSIESEIEYNSPILGQHFFKVRAVSEDGGFSQWSPQDSIELLKSQLDPVRFVQNKITHTVPPYKKPPSASGPNIEWSASQEASTYRLEISKSKGFTEIIATEKLKTNSWRWRNYRLGQFYARVQVIHNDGRKSGYSILAIKLVLPNPAMTQFKVDVDEQIDQYETFKIDIRWKKIPFATSYKLKIGNKKNMNTAKEYKTKLALKNFKFKKAKIYYWQIQPLDKDGKAMSSFSTTQKIDLNLSKGLLAAPELNLPENNSTLFFQDTRFVKFTWGKVKKASSYELQVATDAKFKSNIIEKSVKNIKDFWQGDIKNATYFWRVRSVNKRYKSRWSSPANFSVTGP